MKTKSLGRLEKVDLRDCWKREDTHAVDVSGDSGSGHGAECNLRSILDQVIGREMACSIISVTPRRTR